jgi:membrane associated rhomboid family serine protease
VNRAQSWYRTQPKALKALLTINVALYLVWILVGQFVPAVGAFLYNHVALTPALPDVLFEPWQVLTYNFLHIGGGLGGLLHVLFNMLWLVWIGREYEEMHGSAHMLAVYILTGVGGGVISIALAAAIGGGLFPPNAAIHGASGAVLGLMAVVATTYPYKSIALIFIGTVRLGWGIVGFLVLDILIFSGTSISAHLGGALTGFLMAKGMQKGMDLTSWADVLLRIRAPKRPAPRTSSRGPARSAAAEGERAPGSVLGKLDTWLARRAAAEESAAAPSAPTRSRSATPPRAVKREAAPVPDIQSEVDRILDKISEQGYDALSAEEKRTLLDASQR